jgi:hypothetical protein
VTRALDLRLVGTDGAHEIPPGYEHFR